MLDDPTTPEDQPEKDVGIDIPEVEVPEVDTAEVDAGEVDTAEVNPMENEHGISIPDGSDAPTGLRTSFWAVVLLFNIALLLLSVGPMFALMLGRWRTGGVLFAVGAITFGFGARRVRQIRNERD